MMPRRLDVEAEIADIKDPFLREGWRIVCEHYNYIWHDMGRWPRKR